MQIKTYSTIPKHFFSNLFKLLFVNFYKISPDLKNNLNDKLKQFFDGNKNEIQNVAKENKKRE